MTLEATTTVTREHHQARPESHSAQIAQFGAATDGAPVDPSWRQIGGSACGY